MTPRNRLLPLTAALCLAATLWLAVPAGQAAEDYSAAERALFMTNQLATLKPPITLRYAYRKSGTLEAGFDDTVTMALLAQADQRCCSVNAQFLTGERQLRLPDVDVATGNPVILYFLERDIREMQRLTKGQQNYFRKRIRMAVYQGASVREASYSYRGKPVAGQEITVSPYLDDPNRPRFPKLAVKTYRFMMSDAVPGGVYGIRTQVGGDTAAAPPLLVEELLIDGADAAQK